MSIESIVKEVTEAELEKHYPLIKQKIQKEINNFLNSEKGKKIICDMAENSLIDYIENTELSDLLNRKQILKITGRAFRV